MCTLLEHLHFRLPHVCAAVTFWRLIFKHFNDDLGLNVTFFYSMSMCNLLLYIILSCPAHLCWGVDAFFPDISIQKCCFCQNLVLWSIFPTSILHSVEWKPALLAFTLVFILNTNFNFPLFRFFQSSVRKTWWRKTSSVSTVPSALCERKSLAFRTVCFSI